MQHHTALKSPMATATADRWHADTNFKEATNHDKIKYVPSGRTLIITPAPYEHPLKLTEAQLQQQLWKSNPREYLFLITDGSDI